MPQSSYVSLPAGLLRKVITFAAAEVTQDAAGGPVIGAPGSGITTRASIERLYGQNVYQGEFVSQSTYLIRIRYRTDITPDMTITMGNRDFKILFIDDTSDKIQLLIFCEEIQ